MNLNLNFKKIYDYFKIWWIIIKNKPLIIPYRLSPDVVTVTINK